MDLNMIWAALAGTLLGALADWLFSSLARRNSETRRSASGEAGRRAAASALTLISAAAFVALAWKLRQTDLEGALKLAAMIWLIGPLPLLLADAISARKQPLVAAGNAACWLAKLLLIAAAAAYFLA